jgi:hypothetical protein
MVPIHEEIQRLVENNKEWAWYLCDEIQISAITIEIKESTLENPTFILQTVNNGPFYMSTAKWNSEYMDDYEYFNDIFGSKKYYDVKTNLDHLNMDYPECWIAQRNKGLDGQTYKTKNVVIGLMDRDETSEDFLYFVGEKIRSEAQLEGVWVDKFQCGRFIARYDLNNYPSLIFRFEGKSRWAKTGDNTYIPPFERKMFNPKHVLYLGEISSSTFARKMTVKPKKPPKWVDPDEFCYGALNKKDGICCNITKVVATAPFMPIFLFFWLFYKCCDLCFCPKLILCCISTEECCSRLCGRFERCFAACGRGLERCCNTITTCLTKLYTVICKACSSFWECIKPCR